MFRFDSNGKIAEHWDNALKAGTVMRVRVLILLAATALLYAQKAKDNPRDWPMYTRDLAGTRYSPLKQINAGNVSKLTAAWNVQSARPGGARAAAAEHRPGPAISRAWPERAWRQAEDAAAMARIRKPRRSSSMA